MWHHILDVSIADLKKNYDKLNVEFDLWKKESDVQKYIPDMVQKLKDDGFAHISEGALVVDVTEEGDKKELPPCIIVKSNGATLYATTDLATIVEREKLFQPDQINGRACILLRYSVRQRNPVLQSRRRSLILSVLAQ